MKREDFVFSVGYDGDTAIVDSKAKKRYGKLTTQQLAAEGLYKAAFRSALYSGNEEEIRIIIDEVWVTLGEGEPQEARLPSNELKLVQPFDIEEGQVTVITVDFDAAESVNVTGQDNIIVQPVVKLTVEYTSESEG